MILATATALHICVKRQVNQLAVCRNQLGHNDEKASLHSQYFTCFYTGKLTWQQEKMKLAGKSQMCLGLDSPTELDDTTANTSGTE